MQVKNQIVSQLFRVRAGFVARALRDQAEVLVLLNAICALVLLPGENEFFS